MGHAGQTAGHPRTALLCLCPGDIYNQAAGIGDLRMEVTIILGTHPEQSHATEEGGLQDGGHCLSIAHQVPLLHRQGWLLA